MEKLTLSLWETTEVVYENENFTVHVMKLGEDSGKILFMDAILQLASNKRNGVSIHITLPGWEQSTPVTDKNRKFEVPFEDLEEGLNISIPMLKRALSTDNPFDLLNF